MKNSYLIISSLILMFLAVSVSSGGNKMDKKATAGEGAVNWDNSAYKKAIFAAGCFWGVEELFRKTEGVIATRVGYIGGHTKDPTYRQVCSGNTGHAEAVQMLYDPQKIKYKDLVQIFWDNHNPTTVNRQGPDVGSQYRSAIFYYDDEQKDVALESKRELAESGVYTKQIVTEILPTKEFYSAEDYHQKYLQKKGLKICH